MLYLGIDIGLDGFIVAIDANKKIIVKEHNPIIGNEYDISKFNFILSGLSKKINHCIIEDVHAIFGSSATSTFSFGKGLGIIEALLVANSISYTKVAPKAWQKIMWEGIKPIEINTGKKTKKGEPKYKIDTKKTSLLAAKRLFPEESFLATERSKIPHNGLIDSILLSEYCRKQNY